jgi:uncharacterized protein YjbI with pentapeptide repeats
MANDDHIAQLKKGVGAWNEWREPKKEWWHRETPKLGPVDLSGANLSIENFTDANFEGAILTKAELRGSILENANLSGANLKEANLKEANLGRADLTGASLIQANLEGADLRAAKLQRANLSEANLQGADLTEASFVGADLSGAILAGANLREAKLERANLSGANLTKANLLGANLSGAVSIDADLTRANLTEANLLGANLSGAVSIDADLTRANLTEADLSGAYLAGANLGRADFTSANLSGANLAEANLVQADLTDADLTGCRVYGVSAWNLKLERAKQQNLVITRNDEPEITVDNIEVAQFIYLMLNNQKVRDVIDTITSKAVLILGRFTDKRKAVLDALRDELRKCDYLPILFDFAVPATRDITETVSLLARMARFIIADLTDPSSIPQELQAIVPHLAVPVQPLLEGSSRPYAMFKDYRKYDWVLPVCRYEGLETLLATLKEKVIDPAEEKVKDLRRRLMEEELAKPQ